MTTTNPTPDDLARVRGQRDRVVKLLRQMAVFAAHRSGQWLKDGGDKNELCKHTAEDLDFVVRWMTEASAPAIAEIEANP